MDMIKITINRSTLSNYKRYATEIPQLHEITSGSCNHDPDLIQFRPFSKSHIFTIMSTIFIDSWSSSDKMCPKSAFTSHLDKFISLQRLQWLILCSSSSTTPHSRQFFPPYPELKLAAHCSIPYRPIIYALAINLLFFVMNG